eukprot:scaffold24976_cov20-Tisochrysis_lutea.AAC.5
MGICMMKASCSITYDADGGKAGLRHFLAQKGTHKSQEHVRGTVDEKQNRGLMLWMFLKPGSTRMKGKLKLKDATHSDVFPVIQTSQTQESSRCPPEKQDMEVNITTSCAPSHAPAAGAAPPPSANSASSARWGLAPQRRALLAGQADPVEIAVLMLVHAAGVERKGVRGQAA